MKPALRECLTKQSRERRRRSKQATEITQKNTYSIRVQVRVRVRVSRDFFIGFLGSGFSFLESCPAGKVKLKFRG